MNPDSGTPEGGARRHPGVIYLIGFMGSGKTTLGRALATSVPGWRFVDLDEEIERRAGMSVRKFFDLHGEEAFRSLESATLRSLGTPEGDDTVTVVATGGGTPCRPGAMEWMNSRGLTVLLQASPSRLLARLEEAQEQRPLLRGLSAGQLAVFIASEQMRRAPWYDKAALRFPSDLLETPAEVAASCRRFLEMLDTTTPNI